MHRTPTPTPTLTSAPAPAARPRRVLAQAAAALSLLSLAACGGGGGGEADTPAAVAAPAAPGVTSAASGCGTQAALTPAELKPFEGLYAVSVYDSTNPTPLLLGPATLQLSGSSLQFTPGSGLAGSTAATATVSAVCQNTDSSGAKIGVVAVIDSSRHIDFFSPAFSGLTVSGSDLGSSSPNRYLQATTAAGVAGSSAGSTGGTGSAGSTSTTGSTGGTGSTSTTGSAGSSGSTSSTPPAGALASWADFQAAAPQRPAVAPAGALAWLAGQYHGRSAAGPCSVNIRADGTVSASMNGSTQTAALDGDSGDTWVQIPSNSMNWGVNVVEPGLGVVLTGYGPRLALVEMAGVLDKCAVAFKSDTPLSMALSGTPPVALKNPGLLAADLPAWLVGTHNGQVTGTLLFPQSSSGACSLQVAADGSLLVTAQGRTYAAQVSGGSTQGDRDASGSSRLSAYGALTGAQGWTWSLTGQSPSGSNTVQIQVELAHNGERSQVSFVTAQVAPSVGGLASQLDACYFPN